MTELIQLREENEQLRDRIHRMSVERIEQQVSRDLRIEIAGHIAGHLAAVRLKQIGGFDAAAIAGRAVNLADALIARLEETK